MKKTLNTKMLEAANCGDRPCLDIFDAITPGLCLRVTAAKKSWCFVFTPPGGTSRTRMAFGTFPATDLKAARLKVVELRGLLESGKDPRAIGLAEAPKTMAQLCEDRLKHEVRGKLRRADEMERRYKRNIIMAVGDVPVAGFKIDPHYNKVIDPLVLAGKLRMAGMVRSDLVCLMDFAIERGVPGVEFNRLKATKTKDPGTVRTNFLKVIEIKTLWDELPKAFRRSIACQLIIKLLLVTGQRVGEMSGARRPEFDWKDMVWTIPAERSKNGHAHAVPLSPLAQTLFREAWKLSNSEYLFPNEAGTGPLLAQRVAKTVRCSVEAGDFSVPKWIPHDLRRTVGTQMLNRENGLRIVKTTKYLVLNHMGKDGDANAVSDRHYDMNDYLEEKREALDKWGAFLAQLVGVETGLRVAA